MGHHSENATRVPSAARVGSKLARADGVIGKLIAPTTWTIGGRRNEATRHVRLARPVLAALGRLSPDASGRCAALVFQRPPHFARTRTRGEHRALADAAPTRLAGRRGDVAVWQWGTGPRVLLVHGWGGNAARLRNFVAPLIEAGFGVAAFDAPAHGLSRGSFATLPDFIETVGLVARGTGCVALVGHSMGGAACALAIKRGLPAAATVLLSPPADPLRYALRFARYLRLPNAAIASMTRTLEEHYGARLEDLRVTGNGPAVPMLVVHDEGDVRVPIRDGRAIAESWPRARLMPTRGLGHHRILRDPGVVAAGVAFVRAAIAAGQSDAAAVGAGRRGHAS
jgi:pimeloyl-ACP methyl ester carboxylesterase